MKTLLYEFIVNFTRDFAKNVKVATIEIRVQIDGG